MDNAGNEQELEEARAYVLTWRRAGRELDAQRILELRQMSETESAQRFAHLLSPATPAPLRASSGLVEQQRILARLVTRE
jgi:hypothetical protein